MGIEEIQAFQKDGRPGALSFSEYVEFLEKFPKVLFKPGTPFDDGFIDLFVSYATLDLSEKNFTWEEIRERLHIPKYPTEPWDSAMLRFTLLRCIENPILASKIL